MTTEKTIRCVRCRSEFTEAEISGFNACPNCGSSGVPMSVKQDVTIRINWHELRILFIWAENWAARCKQEEQTSMMEALGGIGWAIHKQAPPELQKIPLTLSGELRELKKAYPSVETHGLNAQSPSDKPEN